MYFMIIQIIGFIAWIILILSYYRKETNKIILLHIISAILYATHYLLLKAYSGFLICLLEVAITLAYYFSNKDKYIFLISVPIYIIIGLFNYTTLVDIIPIVSSLIDNYGLTKDKKNIIKYSIVAYTFWVIYDIFVKSYIGIITEGILVISNILILLFNINIFSKRELK